MKSQKNSSKKLLTIVVIVSIVFVGAIINLARDAMDEAMVESTMSELSQIGAQVEMLLGDAIDEGIEDLELLADAIIENDAENENVIDFLNSQSQAKEFDSLYYIDLDGAGVSTTGDSYDFSENISFINALDNDLTIASPHLSVEAETIVFDIAVPVTRGEDVVGVLFSEALTESFFSVTQDDIFDVGDIFIVDKNLSLIFSTSEGHKGSTFIPEGDVTEMGTENVAKAQSDILQGENGSFFYDYYGAAKVMVYHPIGGTEWAVAINVEIEQFNAALSNAVTQFYTAGSLVYWTIIALVIYITIFQYFSDKKLIKAAYYDSLTGLPNLERFKTLVEEKLRQYPNAKFTMQKMDIAKFSMINEQFGMDIGDKLLLSITKIMNSISSDIEKTFVCAKVGIDEFIMISANGYLTRGDDAKDDNEEKAMQMMPELAGYDVNFRYGRYFIEKGESNVMEMITKTTIAHNTAKLNTKRKIWNYDEEYKQEMLRHAEINNKRKAALENNEFIVYLQPKFSTADDKLVGAEALVRWIEPDGNMIFPNDFIPLFENNGFIVDIDRFVLEEVCKTMRGFIDKGYGKFVVSINCSRLNLENPFFVDGVVAIVDKYNIPHDSIEIELTESTTISNVNTIEQLFADLRENGFRISIDDFGAGYSSLGMLKNLHVDTLKMDRSFFVGGKNARRDDMLIDSIVKMSHNLGMYVVAEGIETPEQVALLKSMNCDAIQGYVHSKPLPVLDFEERYKKELMKNTGDDSEDIPIINNINDTKFANSFAPCGLLITEVDENFTIVEANDYYFDMIGYTREEVRDKFQNCGVNLMDESSRADILKYFEKQMAENPEAELEFVSRFTTKDGSDNTYRLIGRIIVNENGKTRLCLSSTDISDYVSVFEDLQKQRGFVSDIASMTGSSFYEYDIDRGTMRFSKNFAERYGISEVIEEFIGSQIGKDMFASCIEVLNRVIEKKSKGDGEFCITLKNGETVWHTYSCEPVYDESTARYRVVGRISETYGHKLERDILKVKSQTATNLNIYNKQATERYIRNYLRTATENNETGAFFVVKIKNFDTIQEKLGEEMSQICLKDVGDILRGAFRSTDIIGRVDENRFFVFINDYKTIDFVLKKAEEICDALQRGYANNEIQIDLMATIGIALYPEDGDNYDSIYQKADYALNSISDTDKSRFALYGGVCNDG